MRLDGVPGQAKSLVELRGPDTLRFLQGTLSADVGALAPGRAVAGAVLTVKGKLVTEVIVLPVPDTDGIDLLVPADWAEDLAAQLDRHIVMDEVEVRRGGPVALALRWDDDDPDGSPRSWPAGVRALLTRHPAPGVLLLGPEAGVQEALAGAAMENDAGFAAHRIETASPGWGHELAPGFFPPEVGYAYGVSYDKGCYLGQEPLARIHARGQVNRVMVRVEADRMPPGSVDLGHPERPEAGTWTTAASGPTGVIGLAIVRRAFAEPGTGLATVGLEDPISVRVVSGSLGDDPGTPGRR